MPFVCINPSAQRSDHHPAVAVVVSVVVLLRYEFMIELELYVSSRIGSTVPGLGHGIEPRRHIDTTKLLTADVSSRGSIGQVP